LVIPLHKTKTPVVPFWHGDDLSSSDLPPRRTRLLRKQTSAENNFAAGDINVPVAAAPRV
jgi:hypothetical protein